MDEGQFRRLPNYVQEEIVCLRRQIDLLADLLNKRDERVAELARLARPVIEWGHGALLPMEELGEVDHYAVVETLSAIENLARALDGDGSCDDLAAEYREAGAEVHELPEATEEAALRREGE